MRKSQRGFTLVELLISVSLLVIISIVSVSTITTLLRSSVKGQMGVDIESASSFVFLKMENDIKKSYNAVVSPSGSTLTLYQGSSDSPVTVIYKIGACGGTSGLNCAFINRGSGDVKLTDDTSTLSAVSVDLSNSGFTPVIDSGKTVAVNVKIKFVKPNSPTAKMFNAETTLDTTVVLRGNY